MLLSKKYIYQRKRCFKKRICYKHTSIGIKGMLLAAKTLAFTAIDVFTNPTQIQKAKTEFIQTKGHYRYKALLGDRKPALNYRD